MSTVIGSKSRPLIGRYQSTNQKETLILPLYMYIRHSQSILYCQISARENFIEEIPAILLCLVEEKKIGRVSAGQRRRRLLRLTILHLSWCSCPVPEGLLGVSPPRRPMGRRWRGRSNPLLILSPWQTLRRLTLQH